MNMTNEQIQAFKAAAESCGKQEPLSLVVYHGKMCLRNKGGIVFTVLRDICFPEYSAENENYARLAELCTSDSILSLLAERDADKALIAEQAKSNALLKEQRANWFQMAQKLGEDLDAAEKRIAELEARTLTVKLPDEKFCPAEYAGSQLWSETEIWNQAVSACETALKNSCAKQGITLVVGE